MKVLTHLAGFAASYAVFTLFWTILFLLLVGVPFYVLDRVVNDW